MQWSIICTKARRKEDVRSYILQCTYLQLLTLSDHVLMGCLKFCYCTHDVAPTFAFREDHSFRLQLSSLQNRLFGSEALRPGDG